MTIKATILEFLAGGPGTMDEIDSHVLFSYPKSLSAESIRARVYELLKAGKVARIARGTYAIPKKVRKSKVTQAAA